MTNHGLVENMLDPRSIKIKICERIKHGSTRVCEKAGGHPSLGQMAQKPGACGARQVSRQIELLFTGFDMSVSERTQELFSNMTGQSVGRCVFHLGGLRQNIDEADRIPKKWA